MAGTATRYDVTKIRIGSVGQIWADVAIPSAGNAITLHTDGTPESVANPAAKHLGMTKEGVIAKIEWSITDHFADEFAEPIKSTVEQVGGTIEGVLLQLHDTEVWQKLTSSYGTYTSGSGYERLTFGKKSLTYLPVCIIFPTEMDSTKFSVFQLYKAMNTAPFEINVSRKTMSEIPFAFKGYSIPTRAAADTLGAFWQQVA